MKTTRVGSWDIDLAKGTASDGAVQARVGKRLGGEYFVTDIIGEGVTREDAILIGREVLEAFDVAQSQNGDDRDG